MRGGVSTAVFAGAVVVIFVVGFVGGLFVGPIVFAPGPQVPEVLAIATNTPFPPFEFRDEDDNIVGFDIDLITEVMNRMDQDFRIVDFRDWPVLLAAVAEGRVDVAASAMTSSGTVGAARNATMDFSDWYYEADQAVLALTGEDPTTCAASGCVPADFEDISIAAQSGTTSHFWVLDFVTEAATPISGATLVVFPDVSTVLQTLQAGAVDVVVIDKPAGEGTAAANPAFDIVGTIETNELYAFAVPDGDPFGLIPLINEALADIKADGTYDTISDKWF